MKEKYYISTAIAYTSGKPHIGNTYEIVLADAIARFKRLQGYNVYLQTGADEHGEKIELKAKEAGLTPQEFVDSKTKVIKDIWDKMNTSYDSFVRTTDPIHEKQVQKIFKKLYKLLDKFPTTERYALCDQIRRAAISITSNISEGISRFAKKEKAHFMEITYASMMEVDSQLDISVELGYISLEDYKSIHNQVCSIARQLSALRAKILA